VQPRAFNPWIAALAALCGTIDVVAAGMIPLGRTVLLCGTDWVLAYLTIIAIFSVGAFPLAAVVTAVVLVKVVPRLRSPLPWLASTVLLCGLAAASLVLAARQPALSDLSMCSL
jgi:hypothetical protein